MKCAMWIRAALFCAMAACFVPTLAGEARAQSKDRTLGEEARRLRALPKPQRLAKKIWTNDDIPKLSPFGVSVVGPPLPPPESLTKETSKGAGAAGDAATQQKGVEADLAEAKAHLDTASKELDLLERELALDKQQFYSTPDYANDVQGKARLDLLGAQAAAKEQEVQLAKDKVAELETKLAKLKAAGPPAPTAPPQPQT